MKINKKYLIYYIFFMDMINLRNLYVEKIWNNLNAIENEINVNQYGGSNTTTGNNCDDALIGQINRLLLDNELIMQQLIKKLESTKTNEQLTELREKLKKCTDCKDKYEDTLKNVKTSLERFKKNNNDKLKSL